MRPKPSRRFRKEPCSAQDEVRQIQEDGRSNRRERRMAVDKNLDSQEDSEEQTLTPSPHKIVGGPVCGAFSIQQFSICFLSRDCC